MVKTSVAPFVVPILLPCQYGIDENKVRYVSTHFRGASFVECYGKDGKQREKWRWKISGVGRCFILVMIVPVANQQSEI
jgi:hypothetical protein